MVNWKLYIDSRQQQVLKLCRGSLTEGNGYGCGNGYDWGNGYGCIAPDGYGTAHGGGWGDGYGNGGGAEGSGAPRGDGNGRSPTKW